MAIEETEHKKKKKSKKKHSKKQKRKSKVSSQSENDDLLLDLSVELHPISFYIDDKEEMVAQMFESVHGAKLEDLLPPLLKDLPLKELKKLCIQELRSMNKKSILAILAGESAELSGDENKNKTELNIKVEHSDSESESSRSSEKVDSKKEAPPKQEKPESKAMELLELEMRARIIKTMLGKQPNEVESPHDEEESEERKAMEAKIRAEIAERLKEGKSLILQEPPITENKVSINKVSENSECKENKACEKVESVEYSTEEIKKESEQDGHTKKKKISRREFKERMKKAKMNRKYRKRKMSDDEDPLEELKQNDCKEKESDIQISVKDKDVSETDIADKNESDKEEGEIDTNDEDEEGACSSTDSGSVSDSKEKHRRSKKRYSKCKHSGSSDSYSTGSRSWSSSYSRSRSRSISPQVYAQRKEKWKKAMHDSKGVIEKDKGESKSNGSKVSKDNKNGENWGELRDIEFVDSAEDFDEALQIDKAANSSKKPVNIHVDGDKLGLSFSISKKTGASKPDSELPANEKYSEINEAIEENEEISLTQPSEDVNVAESCKQNGDQKADFDDRVKLVNSDDENDSEGVSYTPPLIECAIDQEDSKDGSEINAICKDQIKIEDSKTESEQIDEDGEKSRECEDFYRGADELQFSDEGECDSKDESELLFRDDNIEIEPLIIESPCPVVKKFTEPLDVSWSGKEKKKKEKCKDELTSESVHSFLADKSTEDSSSSSKIAGPDSENSNSIGDSEKPEDVKDDLSHEEKTEIIGVIKPLQTDNAESDHDLEGASWSTRWLRSEKVQKVVSSSKMLSRMRKKIQKKDKDTRTSFEKYDPVLSKLPQPSIPVIGSIEEYERLFGLKVKEQEMQEANNSVTNLSEPAVTLPTFNPVIGLTAPVVAVPPAAKDITQTDSEDNDEDSEEENLWSKIMGK